MKQHSYRGDERRFCFFVSPGLKIALAEQAAELSRSPLSCSLFLFFFPVAHSHTDIIHGVNDAREVTCSSNVSQISGSSCPGSTNEMLLFNIEHEEVLLGHVQWLSVACAIVQSSAEQNHSKGLYLCGPACTFLWCLWSIPLFKDKICASGHYTYLALHFVHFKQIDMVDYPHVSHKSPVHFLSPWRTNKHTQRWKGCSAVAKAVDNARCLLSGSI